MTFDRSHAEARLPSTWRLAPLAKLVSRICNGTTATQNKRGIGLPVTRIETISDGSIDYSKVNHLDVRAEDVRVHRLDIGDVLLSHINSIRHIGKVARYDGTHPLIHGMNLMRVIFDSQQMDSRFGYYALSSTRAKRYFETRAKKAINQASLNRKDIGALPTKVPPLPEQRKIAAILSSLDDTAEKTQEVIDQLLVVKRGLMQGLLSPSSPGHRGAHRLPDEWSLKRVGELGDVVTGSTPSTKNDMFWNGPVPFVTPTDLGSTKRVSVTRRYVTRDGLAQVRRIPPGAVMVTCIASIGKIGIADVTCCTNQQINSIIPNSSVALSEYLYYAISFMSDALVRLAGTTAVPIVSKSKFLAFSLMVPPVAEQREIVKVLSGVDQAIDTNREWRAQLLRAKFGLMSVLLAGELRVAADPKIP